MRRYVLARLAQSGLVVLLSLTAVFGMVRLGGDPVLLFMPMDIQAKDVNEIRQRLGFNDPLAVQYSRFMAGALRGDFGESLRYRRDAFGLVLERLPATLLLAGSAIVAHRWSSRSRSASSPRCAATALVDHVGTLATVLGQATPGFWLGLMLIYLFAVQLRWLPTGGYGTLAQLIMPSVVLAAFFSARVARLTRSAVLEVLGEEYVKTARAKGLGEGRVIGKHTLRNAAIPIVTLAGLEAGQLLGGAVITETIFAWPGLGRLTVQALLNRDFPVVMAAVSFISVVYTLMNLAVDLRLRLARSARACAMTVIVARATAREEVGRDSSSPWPRWWSPPRRRGWRPHDPLTADFVASLKPPGTPGHPLGTDQLGRDLLARVLYGARLARLHRRVHGRGDRGGRRAARARWPASSSAGPRRWSCGSPTCSCRFRSSCSR